MMSRFPVAFRRHGIGFLVIHNPLGNWAPLTVGLPAPVTQSGTPTGLSRFAHMRYGRKGRPLDPGDGGTHTTGDYYPAAASRVTAAMSLHPGTTSIHPRLTFTRHQRGFSFIRPLGLPLTCSPRMERAPLGFTPSFPPRRHRRRMSRWGQAMGTRLSYVTVSKRPSNLRSRSIVCALVAQVVVGHGACTPFFHGQRGRGAVQGLDLGFLV